MNDQEHYQNYLYETQQNGSLVYKEPITKDYVILRIKSMLDRSTDIRNPKAGMYRDKINQLEAVLRFISGGK